MFQKATEKATKKRQKRQNTDKHPNKNRELEKSDSCRYIFWPVGAHPSSKPTTVVSNHSGAPSSSSSHSDSEIRLMIREEFEKMKLSMLQEVRSIIREELKNSN